ncbi:hypothetical protein ACIA8O_26735 [Kitasatospora sp. NPDC051853]|uniref:hypothetical protein n=1 Tax=Kitasatospora sp. NPDC051853 TaxID=3364058 RepID=UPI0037885ABE
MTVHRRTLHLDPAAPFGVRPDADGDWSFLCRERHLPSLLAYSEEDGFLLLAADLPEGTAPPATPVVHTSLPAPDHAELLGLPPTVPVTHIDLTADGSGVRIVAPAHLWDLAPS